MTKIEESIIETKDVNFYQIIAKLKKFIKEIKNIKSLEDLNIIMSEIQSYIFENKETRDFYINKINEHIVNISQTQELKILIEKEINKSKYQYDMNIPDILFFEFGNSIQEIDEENMVNFPNGIINMYELLLKSSFTFEYHKENDIVRISQKYPEFISSVDFYILTLICKNIHSYGLIDTKSARLYIKSLLFGIIIQLINFLDTKANNMFYGEYVKVYLVLNDLKHSSNDLFKNLQIIKENENLKRNKIAKKIGITPGGLDKQCEKFIKLIYGEDTEKEKGLAEVIKVLGNINFAMI